MFAPAASCKSQGLPLAYNRLSVRTLPACIVSVTLMLLDTFTKLAVARLPRLAFRAVMLPLKFAVLPDNSRFTVTLLVVTLLATFTKLACARLPRLALPESRLATMLALLVNSVLVTLALPVTVKILLEESNTKLALAAKLLLSLN